MRMPRPDRAGSLVSEDLPGREAERGLDGLGLQPVRPGLVDKLGTRLPYGRPRAKCTIKEMTATIRRM
jgi:hypothetical protein